VQKCFFAVLFGSNGNTYTVSTHSDTCMYTHILHNIETLVGQRKKRKLGQQSMTYAKEIFLRAILGTCALGLPALISEVPCWNLSQN